MSFPLRLLLAALVVGALIGAGTFLFDKDPSKKSTTPVAGPPTSKDPTAKGTTRWTSSKQCKSCHEDVYAEWQGSHHQIAYLNPEVRELSDDFRNKECKACHLPQPVAVTGFGRRVLPRMTQPDEGVSCLTCHLAEDGSIMGRNDRPQAGCAPKRDERFLSVQLCASCHNQHKTTDQWHASPYKEQQITCNSCHMPEVARTDARSGFGHVFPGAHDKAMLQRAGRLTAALVGTSLKITLRNVGAGHNFPTEERHRAVDIMYRFALADGKHSEWQRAYRFRSPYRDEVGEDTQLPAGQEKTIAVDAPENASGAEVKLWYALQPYVPIGHEKTTLLHSLTVARGETKHSKTEPMNARPRPTKAGGSAQPDRSAAVQQLRALTNAAPKIPDQKRMAQVADLIQTAFVPARGLERLAQKAKTSLLEQDNAFWGLERALTDDNVVLRSNAAWALGEINELAAVPVLLLRLKYEKDPGVVAWIIRSLCKLDNHAGLETLATLMDREASANTAGTVAIEVLRAAGRELSEKPTYDELKAGVRKLYQTWQQHGGDATKPKALLQARIAEHLIAMTGFQLRPVDNARFVLQRMGKTAVPMLTQAIASEDAYLRTHSLEVLHDLGRPGASAADAVIRLLDAPRSAALAARTLGRIGADAARPRLLTLLHQGNEELRMSAAEALGYIGNREDLPTLLAQMNNSKASMDIRVRAAFAAALIDPTSPGRAFLQQRKVSKDYHPPTIVELLDRLPPS